MIIRKPLFLFVAICLLFSSNLLAQITSNQSGDWNDTNTWVGGVVPTSGDVIIATTHTVIYNANHNTSNAVTITSLDVQGTGQLVWPFSDDVAYDANFTFTVTGAVTIASTASLTNREGDSGVTLNGNAADRTHQVNLRGGLTNAGTLDFTGTSTSRIINTDFNTNSQVVSGAGTFTFYNVDINGTATTTEFQGTTITIDNVLDLQGSSTLEVNGGQLDVGPDIATALDFESDNTTFRVINSAVVNIRTAAATNNSNAVRVNGDNCTFDVQSGTVTIGNPTGTGEGRFRIENAAATDFSFDLSGGTVTIGDHINHTAASVCDFNITGGTLNVGTGDQGGEAASTIRVGSTFTVDGGTAAVNFGENPVFNIIPTIANGATFSVGTNASQNGNFDINNTWTLDNASTITADAGLDINTGAILNLQGNSILNIVSDDVSLTTFELSVTGTLNVNTATVNIAGSVVNAGSITNDIVRIQEGGVINLNDGTINLLENAGFTDGSKITGGQAFELNGATTATFNVGDGAGSAGSARINIATNLASQSPPTEEDLFRINSDDGVTTVNSDGVMNIGGGNIGSLLLDDDTGSTDADFQFVVQGGTVNIAGALDIDHGAGFQLNNGTVNIGIEASSGVNDIDFGTLTNTTHPTIIEINGGTMNVGDGAVNTILGNNNNSPAHGTTDAYIELEVAGGTLNYNGRLRIRDSNARFLLSGSSTINFNPQGANSLDPDLDILFLENCILDISGPVNINFLNPHAATGTGNAIEIQGVGAAASLLTSSFTTDVDAAVDFSNVTWGFGDGTASSNGTDGFDLDFATGHTSYGNIVVNNPSGTGREVVFTNTGNAYLTSNITVTEGVLDIGNNSLDDNGSGNTFELSANGTLKLDSNFPGSTSANYTTYTLGAGSTVDYNATSTVTDAQIPDGTGFSNLTISGTNTKTLNGTASIGNTLTLTSGTLAAGTNLTMGAATMLSRAAGTITGDLQGSNAYTIEYTGTSKSIDISTDAEWSGDDLTNKNLIVNLDMSNSLTVQNNQLDVVDLTITQGTLTDADAGFLHDVTGNLSASGDFSGLGAINITGGAATHTLSSSGTAAFSNLTMNDASFDASGDLSLAITGTLTLTAGDIQVTSGTVTMNSGAAISGGTSSSYLAFDGTNGAGGMVQTYTSATDSKTYPIGTTTEYTPGTVTLTAASGFGALTIIPIASGSPFTLDGSSMLDLNYHWQLTTDGSFTGVTANHSFIYDESDIQGVEGSYVASRYNVSSPSWSNSDDTADGVDGVNSATNTITLTGTDFVDGHITAGEIDEFSGVITTFYLRSDIVEPLDWNDDTHWTNTDGGTVSINRTPGTNSPVVINRIVNIDDDGQSAGSINIDTGGVLIIGENAANTPSSGHTLGTVTGIGTLRIISDDTDGPTFPDENGANWTAFLGASGSTVEYSGDGSYTLPSDVSTYNNLVVTSTSAACSCTKTFGDADLTITGDLTISGANTTSAAISDATNGNLTIAGALTIEATNTLSFSSTTARTVEVTGAITNAGTFNVANSGSAEHSLSTGASLTSDGTFDMNTGGSTVDVTFTGSGNATISGSGSADFNNLIVNKGSSQATTLEATVSTFTITGTGSGATTTSLDLQNGTFIISTSGTHTVNTNGNWTIPSTAKLDLNSGSPVVQMTSSSAATLLLNGALQVTTGTLTIGDQTDNVTDNSIRYDGSAAEIIVDGGTLNVGGAIRPNVTDGSAVLAFTLSDGTVSLARNTSTNNISATSTTNRSEADFSLDNAAASFTMSNGILEIVRAQSVDGKAISISNSVTTSSVTGGTVNILRDAGDAFSSNSTNQGNDVSIYSNVPLWNLQVGDGDYPGDFGNPNTSVATNLDLTILNDLTINLNNTTAGQGNFDMFRADRASSANEDGFNISVGGTFTLTDGTFTSNDDGLTGTLVFNGAGLAGQTSPQVINNNGETLGSIEINNTDGSGSVDLGAALAISGNWTYTVGTFNQGGNAITMTNAVSLATSINGNASFDNITLSNTNGISLASGDMTINSGGALTISDDVIFDIGDNGLIISEQSAGGITFSATPDETNMIRVSGLVAGKGVTRTYPDATTTGFIYQIGATISATDYYLPAQIDLTAGGGAASTATVLLVASQHPQATDAQNALNVYWSVSETGFDNTQTAAHTYTYGTDVADIVEGADDTNFLDAYNVGSPTFVWTEGSTANVTEFDLGSGGVVTFTDPGSDNIAGDFTAGVDAAFNAVTVFYTIRDGDWDNTTTLTTPWTNDICGGAQTEAVAVTPDSDDPVVICSGNTVTITTATGLDATSIDISGTLTSQVADISIIGDISGTGSLEFSHTTATTPVFGTLSSDFIADAGGTINYGGTMGYTLPTNDTYNNLTISNSATVILPSSLTVNGDATFNGGTIDQAGFTVTDGDNGGTFSLGSGTTLEVDGTDNFPTNFSVYTFDGASTVDYISAATQTILGNITYGNIIFTRTGGDPVVKSLGDDIVVMGDLTIGRRSELQASTHSITIHGNWSTDSRNTTNFDPGTGTVTFASTASSQSLNFTNGADEETFYNLVINQTGSGTDLSFGGNVTQVTVSNNLTITDETLAMGTTPLIVTGTLSTAAAGTFTSSVAPDLNGNLTNAGTFTVPTSVNLSGDFTNTGTYTTASNTLVFDNTTTAQSINGNATSFNNITAAKASGVDLTLNAATTITGILALQNEGNVVLSSGNLTLEIGSNITGNAGGSAIGDFSAARMIRTSGGGSDPLLVKNADADTDWDLMFPIGVDDSGNKFTPITVDATTDNITAGTLSVRSINGTSTDQSISGSATTLNRHYNVDITGLTGTVTFDLIFQYDNGDVVGTEGDYLSAYSERSVDDGWVQPVASQSNANAASNQFGASVSLNGTIDFGADINTEWIAGDSDLIFPHFYTRAGGGIDCSGITCDWDEPTHWTLSDGGTTSAGSIPQSTNLVTISSGHTMAMDNNTNVASELEVLGTLDLAATTGHTLGDLIGTGTIQIESNALDTYVNTAAASTFLSATGGTVEYGGVSAYTLPTAITEYNNLIIVDGTQGVEDKNLGINTTVHGDLTVNTVDFTNSSNLELELRGDFNSVSSGRLQVEDGTFTWANTLAASLSSNILFGSAGSLTLDNFGEKDLSAALIVNNITLNSSSGNFDANSNNIEVTGNWDNRASSNRLTNPATTTFNGAAAQQLDGDNTFATTNISSASTAVTVGSGTQTFTGVLTLAGGTSLDIGANTIRVGNTLDVDAGTFTGASGRVVYTSTTDPETQVDPITVGTLELDKGGVANTFANDPLTVTFSALVITSGEYDGPDADLSLTGDFTVSADGAIVTTGITNLDIDGDFSNAATLDLSSLTSMNIGGDFSNTGTFTAPTSVIMDGATAQQLNNALSVSNFTKSGGGDLTLNDDLSVVTALTLTSGDIISSSTNTLTLEATAANPTGSAGSHVIGTMIHTSPAVTVLTTKIYPLGDGTNFRPVELDVTQTSGVSRTYTASLNSGAAASRTKPVGINHVSNIRHYNITQSPTEALTAGAVRITYGSDDGVEDTGNLLIAKDDGAGNWLDLGGSVAGLAAAGTISSTVSFTSFSDFVLASSADEASLPVDLIAFEAKFVNDLVSLTWSTASEINNDRFEIQRSKNGLDFETIGVTEGGGNSRTILQYTYSDRSPLKGTSHYRLKQVDFDGQFEYSPVRIVTDNLLDAFMTVEVFPNPTSTGIFSVLLDSEDEESVVNMNIFNYSGKLIYQRAYSAELQETAYEVELPADSEQGVYLIHINQNGHTHVAKFILN